MPTVLRLFLSVWLALAGTATALAADPAARHLDWPSVLERARGQTVYFNAWGGARNINDYIAWAGERLKRLHGVELVHVKLDDTGVAVAKVLAEKAAGVAEGGSIDLIWINGENFAAMKAQGLLLTPGWADLLPNWRYVDWATKPTILSDFTTPTDGLEAPWGMAKLVFFHDTARGDDIPDSFAELVEWTARHPGRFTYPAPPDFIGATFLKQALAETVADPAVLSKPVVEADFAQVTAPLFAALDVMHPNLWRGGRTFPRNKEALRRLLADDEIDIAFAFSPAEASNAIAAGELPDTVRSFVFSGGTLANTHFVAIPFNASAREGALVVADFLMSPEAQLHKQDPAVWGDPTVLDTNLLPSDMRDAFAALDLGVATLAPAALGPSLPEPDATWMTRLEKEWTLRYGVAN